MKEFITSNVINIINTIIISALIGFVVSYITTDIIMKYGKGSVRELIRNQEKYIIVSRYFEDNGTNNFFHVVAIDENGQRKIYDMKIQDFLKIK